MSGIHKVATVQFEPTMFEKERNIARLLELCEEAAKAGARLIVTPEMGTTGYCWFDRDEVRPFVETVPGPTTARFVAIARAYDCYIVLGLPEVDDDDIYFNSAVLIGPRGVIGTHRKSHPYIAEPKWAAPGDVGHQVFDTPIGRIALLICMDIHFIETARLAALGGADIICHISNWLAERAPAPYWISRAYENGCYVIESNRWGLERTVQFSGGSCVIAPDGTIAAVIDGGDGFALAEVDLGRARARKVAGEAVFAQRRPELYAELMTNPHSWNPRDFFGLYGHQPWPEGRRSRVSVAQFAPTADMAANLAAIATLAGRARGDDAALVVFPELALTGFADPAATAQPLAGEVADSLVALAARLQIHLVVGLAERDGGAIYNSACLVGPDGVTAVHRKLHLTAAEQAWAVAGDTWTVADTPVGRVGLLIGHDASFPEAGRVLALRGCDVIACPAAIKQGFSAAHAGTVVAQPAPIPTGADPHHWHHYRVRAGENNVFFAFANVRDPANGYPGLSGVFGPDTFEFPRREAIAAAGEGHATAVVDTTNLASPYPTNVVRRKDLMVMRLPHHYRPLVQMQQGETVQG
ncbi:amidohydrolase [Bradyrhizobium sp. U87765 SZCCT0131]|uniref:nitrilase-related carbon-nitrogen hydrolase n=1 Tax=unclassified Bradyrhizobium TaxID=2631580 RepID=UPI001BAD323F|nr:MULTISPECIES: nitrilase-related carbon-nitrogen hydrolase [unclassified Bradyrhizobium]MBR1219878.1 amidohydrolase [Bradyrhizobium sp. U87765 SZCCT0131]MBR1262529.1 amidohydrolase [Bradyrhizobium sp. U87765 SZCCT0134]MBR1308288.1 amidohydrolase [Bradyrhizobium sp. U87765 SZCCT0110]MBR1318311.1 amidohydrolase [Bradyrhizobium sp. U87765 SZCCT0109]MBR1352014.1 amidohydrolase [Bradyrhizobium sp. U87765 SZCCT0048]